MITLEGMMIEEGMIETMGRRGLIGGKGIPKKMIKSRGNAQK